MNPWIPDMPPTLSDFFALAPGPFPALPMVAAALAALYLTGAVRM